MKEDRKDWRVDERIARALEELSETLERLVPRAAHVLAYQHSEGCPSRGIAIELTDAGYPIIDATCTCWRRR